MKRVICILLAAIAMIGLQATADSATLDSSWYVHLNWAEVYNYQLDPVNNFYYQAIYDGNFTTPVGQYGPFAVTNPGSSPFGARFVTIPVTAQGSPSDNLIIPFTTTSGLTNAYVSFSCYTNYDPSQMYVSLWQVLSNGTNVELWSQTKSGAQAGGPDIFQPVTSQNYYFLISVVPEPSSIAALLVGLSATGCWTVRRRRCV